VHKRDLAEVPPLPPEDELGPKMKAVPERMRVFVWEYVHNGGNQSRAVRVAGYSDEGRSGHSTAWRLLTRQDVQEAVHEASWATMHSLSVKAIGGLELILKMGPSARGFMKAVEIVLNRSGFIEKASPQNINVRITDERQMANHLLELAKKNGIDPVMIFGHSLGRMLPKPDKVVDGEIEEVEIVDGTEGLEDVL